MDITIQRALDAPFELINERLLRRLDSGFENAHERTSVVEYALDGRIVHRSAHVRLKEWPDGFNGLLGTVRPQGFTPSDLDPERLKLRHLPRGFRFANTQAFCTQAKADLMNGLHAFGTTVVRAGTTKDSYKAALYLASASRGAGDTVYSATGEVSGSGYSAGGVAVTTGTGPSTSGTTAFFTPSASIVYTTVTLATAFDAMGFYNDTSSTKLMVAIFTFGSQTVTAGTFTLTMPTNDASNALIRIA